MQQVYVTPLHSASLFFFLWWVIDIWDWSGLLLFTLAGVQKNHGCHCLWNLEYFDPWGHDETQEKNSELNFVEGSSTLPDTGPLEWAKPMSIALEMFVFDIEAMLQWCYCIGHLMKYLYRLITCCCFLVLFLLVACFYVAILIVQVDTKQWTNTPKHILFNSHFFN